MSRKSSVARKEEAWMERFLGRHQSEQVKMLVLETETDIAHRRVGGLRVKVGR